jgi:Rad3-related DNA helicase
VGSGGFGFDNLAGSGLYVQDTNVPETPRTARPAVSNANEEHQVLENAKEANQLYYQFRETNRAYRARQIARDRASPEAAAKAALDDLPRWLGPDELNQASGKISWPAALQSDEFGSLRTAIEDQFRSRARKDSVETTTIIKEQIKEMIGLLRAHIEEMPADEFMTARKFLDSLDYAMHHPVPR